MKPWRKLSDAQVLSACAEYAAGASIKPLAAKHGIHHENMRRLLHGLSYKYVRRPALQIRQSHVVPGAAL